MKFSKGYCEAKNSIVSADSKKKCEDIFVFYADSMLKYIAETLIPAVFTKKIHVCE